MGKTVLDFEDGIDFGGGYMRKLGLYDSAGNDGIYRYGLDDDLYGSLLYVI